MSTPSPSVVLLPSSALVTVVCLCAQWCGVCRDYQPLMQAALAGFEPAQVHAVWLDIEDHNELLGDLDVEDFPTLLIARNGKPLFYGTVLPHAATLTRLVERALAGRLAPLAPTDGPNEQLIDLLGRV